MPSPDFVVDLLGYREDKAGNLTEYPNIADSSSKTSVNISRAIVEAVGTDRRVPFKENSGVLLEQRMRSHLLEELRRSAPGRDWTVDRRALPNFEQYVHLSRLQSLIDSDESRVLAMEIGSDYVIAPDVTVGLPGVRGRERLLHAAISCKWTLRSDRAQNVRHEAVTMIRHRRGRLPHIVGVTMEPLPSRIAALARGTGEVDLVFHPVLDELCAAVAAFGGRFQQTVLHELITQDRLRPVHDLPAILIST